MSLRKDKRDEKALDCKKIKIRIVRGGGHPCVRLCSHEPVELADAVALRMATHQSLAGLGPLTPQPDTLRRIPWPAGSTYVLASPHDGALGTNDTRRTREVPRRHAPSLRPISTTDTGGEDLSGRGSNAVIKAKE